jgi:hypothetical protein
MQILHPDPWSRSLPQKEEVKNVQGKGRTGHTEEQRNRQHKKVLLGILLSRKELM